MAEDGDVLCGNELAAGLVRSVDVVTVGVLVPVPDVTHVDRVDAPEVSQIVELLRQWPTAGGSEQLEHGKRHSILISFEKRRRRPITLVSGAWRRS